MLRFVFLSFTAILATAGFATAHYNGAEAWHDLGQDLGMLDWTVDGVQPSTLVKQDTGICWYSESQGPVDLDDGVPVTHLADLLSHRYGIGVDPDQKCQGQAEDPAVFVAGGTSGAFPLVYVDFGAPVPSVPS